MDTFVEVPGGRLRVRDEGAGPPIVLIHAGIAQLESWDLVAGPLVSAGHRVVRHDLRSWGESRTEHVPFSHRADLIALLDARGIGSAVLVGNSMGGVHAFDTALEHPTRVGAVVGVAAGLRGYDGGETPLEHELFAQLESLESAPTPDPDAIAELDVQVWVDGPGQPAGRAPGWIRDTVRDWDRALNRPGRVTGLEVRLDPPAVTRVAELTCPVLAVAGSLDVSDVAATAHFLAAHAEHARAVIWDDVAHMIGMEQPDRLAAEILEFVGALGSWG